MARVPYNKLLTNLVCLSRIGEYWSLVVFVQTSLCFVHTAKTSGQYSAERPSRLISMRLRYHGRWIDSVWKSHSYMYTEALIENPIILYVFWKLNSHRIQYHIFEIFYKVNVEGIIKEIPRNTTLFKLVRFHAWIIVATQLTLEIISHTSPSKRLPAISICGLVFLQPPKVW